MTHILTGATGFVGSALTLELLQNTDDLIIGVVRPKKGLTPIERLRGVLLPLIEGYGLPASLTETVMERVSAVPGDLAHERLGVGKLPITDDVHFWHCAASLQYQDRHRAAIDRSNITGTMNALELARSLGADHFNMVSTAYVAGSQSGRIEPVPGRLDLVNNLYERSKVIAEDIVRSSGLRYRIMRPGVVIGHSQTRHTTSSDGLYGFLRGLRKFRGILERTQPGLAERLVVRVRADAEGTIDFVPVDHVAADAVALHRANAPQGHYHLTNPTPPLIADALRSSFAVAGLQQPLVVENRDGFTATDIKLGDRIDFYSSYIVNPKHFDRSSVDRVIGAAASPGLHIDPSVMTDFCRWYMDDFELGRARLPVAR